MAPHSWPLLHITVVGPGSHICTIWLCFFVLVIGNRSGDTSSHLSPSYFFSREFRIAAKRQYSVSTGYLNLGAIEQPSLTMACENSDWRRRINPWWVGTDTRECGIPLTVTLVSNNGFPPAGSTKPMCVSLTHSFPGSRFYYLYHRLPLFYFGLSGFLYTQNQRVLTKWQARKHSPIFLTFNTRFLLSPNHESLEEKRKSNRESS